MTDKQTDLAGPLGSALERPVWRPVPERAIVGVKVACEVREPHPATLKMTLETPAAVAYANTLLADKRSGWRMVRGCHECAWGKVAGCWRCGSR